MQFAPEHEAVKAATGAVFSVTVTVLVTSDVEPGPSVTVRVTEWVPAVANACAGALPVAVAPSSNCQANVSGPLSVDVEPAQLAVSLVNRYHAVKRSGLL